MIVSIILISSVCNAQHFGYDEWPGHWPTVIAKAKANFAYCTNPRFTVCQLLQHR